MKRFSSKPLDLPADREHVVRADLVFYGVDHSGPSYEARIFLDNPKASARTPREAGKGYAGSFTIFGNGGCFGGEGHCSPQDRYTDEFDRRPPHPMTPQTVTVTITEALAALTGKQARVTVVAVPREQKTAGAADLDVAPCDSVRLVTYAA